MAIAAALALVLGSLSPIGAVAQVRDTRWQVAEIYMATMDAAPDEEGLAYWVNNIETTDWVPLTVAQSFFDQPLVQARYPTTVDNTFFINSLYQNILGRNPDGPGLNYWLGELQSGKIARNQMIIALINGAYAAAQTDPLAVTDVARFTNRVRVALAFADYQATYDIRYSQLGSADKNVLLDAGQQVLTGVGPGVGDDLTAIARIPELLGPINGELNTPISDAYTPGTPAPTAATTLRAEADIAPNTSVAVVLSDGTRVDLPASGAAYNATLERSINTVPWEDYFPRAGGMQASGAMRTLQFTGTGDASALKPIVTIPRAELGTLNPETVFVLREATTWVDGDWVDNHFTVLSAEFDAAGNLKFIDPLVPASLVTYLFSPDSDDSIDPAPVMLSMLSEPVAADSGMTWIGNVRYSVMSFEQSLNWSEAPRLVRMVPDPTRSDGGYRHPATTSELQSLQRQPICNVVLLVHGHNEGEKRGFEPADGPAPWRVGYKRLVWDLLYKAFLDGGTSYPQDCTAFYEFIYPSYRPIFSPVLEKSGFPAETLGESLGRLFKRELTENRQLAAMMANNMPFNLSVVAHSMGGLVARAGLRHLPDKLLDRYDRLVTWGTPHHGAGLYSLLYAMRAGHDLNWMGARIPMQNIGQRDFYDFQGKLDGVAIDTPGTRDLRWSAGRKSMMALGTVMAENAVTGFDRSEVELPNGSRFYSTNLHLFNESEGRWMGDRLDNTFTFFYGTTSKKAEAAVSTSWTDWLYASLVFGAGSTSIEQGAYLNSIAMQPSYRPSDGAVPVWSQRAAGLGRPYGIKRVAVGDVDHEEFYGAEPDQRNEATLSIGESIAEQTLSEASLDQGVKACPVLDAAVAFRSGNVAVDGTLSYPALAPAQGGDGLIGARIADLQLRRDRPDGTAVSGLSAQISDSGNVSLTGPASAVSGLDSAYLVAVLRDGSEVASAALTGFEGGTEGERVAFSYDYRYEEGSSSDWPDPLLVTLAGDLRINVTYRGDPFRQVVIRDPVFSVEGDSVIRPTLVFEVLVPWYGADYDVAIEGSISIRPNALSGTHERDGSTWDWQLSLPSDPLRQYTQDSCAEFGNRDQLDIREDGSAGLALSVSDLGDACDITLNYVVAPFDSYVYPWGNPRTFATVYPRVIVRISGYD